VGGEEGSRGLEELEPSPRDPTTDLGMAALGPNKDQLPQDLNVTFFFEYEKGTIETIEIINTTNCELDT
jgi:hypothetical protein